MSDERVRLIETVDGYLSVHPLPTADDLARHYDERYYGQTDGRNQYAHGYTPEELEHKGLASAEAEHFAPPGARRYLELGFGEGFGIDWFSKRGWEVAGYDFTLEGLRHFFPALEDRVRAGDALEAIDSLIAEGREFDLVVCNNVLEHVIDPEELVRSIERLLAPRGVARIAVPNDGSWLQQLAIERKQASSHFFVRPPEHLHYFTAASLRRLLERSGLSVVALLGDFPIDLFLLNPDSNYEQDPPRGRNCHFARVAFDLALWRRSLDELIAFRRGCAEAGIGRGLVAYVTRAR